MSLRRVGRVGGTLHRGKLSCVVTVRSSPGLIAATLAALGSGAILPACDRHRPATEVPGTAPSVGARVPDGVEPRDPKADRAPEEPTDEELELLLEASDQEIPTAMEGACGGDATSEANCGACGAASCGADQS